MAAGGRIFGLARRPRSYNNRPILDKMADCEVLERFRLSRAHIKWLVDELEEYSEKLPAVSGNSGNLNVVLLLVSLLHV